MFDTQSWDRFVHATPGRRFQERYKRKAVRNRGRLWRWAAILAGVGLTALGVFFLVVPGPGIPILAIGLALIAQESAIMARFLDRAEVRLRLWWKRLRSSYTASGSRTRPASPASSRPRTPPPS